MKLTIKFFTGFVILGLASPVWAANVEIPAGTPENRLDLSAGYSRFFGRDLKAGSGESDEISAGDQIHVRIGWLFRNWLEPYVKAGVASYDEQLKNLPIAGIGRRHVSLEYDVGAVWGGGLAGSRPFGEGWFVGYDAQWVHSDNDLDSVTHTGNPGTFISGGASIDQWHIAGYVGKEFLIWREYKLTPYVGGRYSGFDLNIDKDIAYTVSEGTVVIAEGQVKGRGRLGRSWASPKGKGIYLSIILRPELLPAEAAKLTLLAAVALCDAVKSATNLEAAIKWPNDVLISGKKVAGVLTELNAETDRVKFVVVGIGLNVNAKADTLPSGATSLRSEAKKQFSRVEVTKEILKSLEHWYLRAQRQGFLPVAKRWKELSVTLNKRVKVVDQSGEIEGEAVDIDRDGGLMIRKDSGILIKRMAGDVVQVR